MPPKRKIRPSPAAHSADLKVGTIRKGSDRRNWVVVKRSTGHHWVHLQKSKGKKKKAPAPVEEVLRRTHNGTWMALSARTGGWRKATFLEVY